MRKKPADALGSVDNALRLIHLLRDQGKVSVTEAATSLGISVSSAHRLLTTLAYRDFAQRDERRMYVAGPALSLRGGTVRPIAALRTALLPTMRRLSATLEETISLGVLIEDNVRIIATVEASRVLRVGDQEGTVLPAHLAASGKAMLALQSDDELAHFFLPPDGSPGSLGAGEWRRLREELRGARENGFALNHGEAENGVSAIGVPIQNAAGRVLGGLAAVMPSVRFSVRIIEHHVNTLRAEVAAAMQDLPQEGIGRDRALDW